jgi:hypothetical protein
MTHPIVALQSALVTALRADADLVALMGEDGVFDAPPAGRSPPYVTIARHDVLARDGDAAPGHEHRLLLHAWSDVASRRSVAAIAEHVVATALGADLDGATLRVTNRRHDRTDTAIDGGTGVARAAIALTFYSEPNS